MKTVKVQLVEILWRNFHKAKADKSGSFDLLLAMQIRECETVSNTKQTVNPENFKPSFSKAIFISIFLEHISKTMRN